MVLAHVTNRLHTLVSTLTVQIFKDDWTRPSLVAGALPSAAAAAATLGSPSDYGGLAGFPSHGHGHSHGHPHSGKPLDMTDPLTSTPAKPTSPPPEFSFNTPGKNIQPVVLPSTQSQRPYGMGLAYGASPYAGMLTQGFMPPGGAGAGGGSTLGLGMGLGMGARGAPSVQGFRTSYGGAPPNRYGSNLFPSQMNQYKP